MTSDVRDHLTEIPPLRWVIAAFQCYKLFDRGRLAVALHYTEFQAIFFSFPEISTTQRASFPPRTDAADDWSVCLQVREVSSPASGPASQHDDQHHRTAAGHQHAASSQQHLPR